MDRFILTDAQWEKMVPFCLGKPANPVFPAIGDTLAAFRRNISTKTRPTDIAQNGI